MDKQKLLVYALAAVLVVGGVIGAIAASNSKADSLSTVGYVNVSYLLSQHVYPKVKEPVQAELKKYQAELDAKIEKLEGSKEEKEAEAKKLYAEYQKLLDEKEKELAAPYLEELRKAIDAVAKEQGLKIVLDNVPTGVERPVVVWGGVDINQAVLDYLNKKK